MTEIAKDKKEIESIQHAVSGYIFQIGVDGVTKIEAYDDTGEMAYVPWVAIWKNESIYARLKIGDGMYITYKED